MRRIRVGRWFVTASVVTVLALTLTAATRLRPLPDCKIAAQWVSTHRGVLPSTLPAFAEYSRVYQRAIYVALPVEVRKQLWRRHLSSFVSDSSPLTPEQKRMVRDVIARLDLFMDEQAGKAAVMDAAPKLLAVFGKPLAKRVFVSLGGEERSSRAGSARVETVLRAGLMVGFETDLLSLLSSRVHRLDNRSVECDCAPNWGCWVEGQGCVWPYPECEEIPYGCGWLWSEPCTGKCMRVT